MQIFYELIQIRNLPAIRVYRTARNQTRSTFRRLSLRNRTLQSVQVIEISLKKGCTQENVIEELKQLMGAGASFRDLRASSGGLGD